MLGARFLAFGELALRTGFCVGIGSSGVNKGSCHGVLTNLSHDFCIS